MAEKKSKKKTKSKAKPVVVPEKVLPPAMSSERTFVMSMEEIFSLVQILGFSVEVFKQMSLNCAAEGDDKSEKVYRARSELSEILFNKVRAVASIGEPSSRTFH